MKGIELLEEQRQDWYERENPSGLTTMEIVPPFFVKLHVRGTKGMRVPFLSMKFVIQIRSAEPDPDSKHSHPALGPVNTANAGPSPESQSSNDSMHRSPSDELPAAAAHAALDSAAKLNAYGPEEEFGFRQEELEALELDSDDEY